MRTVLMLLAGLVIAGSLSPMHPPARAATDDATETNPPPQSQRDCERRRDTPTS